MKNKTAKGHLAALFTILIWGTTFISTKVLLQDFLPAEILFVRFVIGFLALWMVCPRRLKGIRPEQELLFAGAGLCGVCLYYLLENIALTLTMASNVGVIISVAPFFTAIFSRLFLEEEERLGKAFAFGFMAAMGGIGIISFSDTGLELNPAGDLLALLAAGVWAVYSILSRKISEYGYPAVLTTRRIFFYGILFMVPVILFFDIPWKPDRFFNPVYCFNLLFLGLGASALCFVTWNAAVAWLGAVKTSAYIYLVPVITVAASALILKEPFTWRIGAGMILTVAGLFLSEGKGKGGNQG